jgi:nitrogen fixation NifU-like protein
MSGDLYDDAIMTLARAETGHGRLADADASVTLDNPLCGDRVVLDVKVDDGRVAAVGHEVKGCALCKAAASALAGTAPGRALEDAPATAERLRRMLREPEVGPPAGWDALAPFRAVHGHKSRYRCVLLPFEALARLARELAG